MDDLTLCSQRKVSFIEYEFISYLCFFFYVNLFILINNCTPVVLYKIIQIDVSVFFF